MKTRNNMSYAEWFARIQREFPQELIPPLLVADAWERGASVEEVTGFLQEVLAWTEQHSTH